MADPNPLTRYYTEAGTPPGRWMGSALHAFGNGEIKRGRHGDAAAAPAPDRRRAATRSPARSWAGVPRVPDRSSSASPTARPNCPRPHRRAAQGCSSTQIKAEESKKPSSGVAGFDYTFSVPKSVSALWGVADAGTQALIVEAHHQAVAEVLDFMEREVAATRRGVAAGDGAVMQADVIGVAATAYDHWDSRLGDPQLHTHVVISNKVKTTEDGRWRSLDGRPDVRGERADLRALQRGARRPPHPTVRDRVGAAGPRREPEPGLGACARPRDADPRVLQPVPPHRQGEGPAHRGVRRARHGHRPSPAKIIQLRAKATLATRPEKEIHSLFDLTTEWRGRAQKILGRGAVDWAKEVTARPIARPTLRADDVPLDAITEVAVSVVGAVEEKRSTWKHWNLWAEASRQTMGWRFASAEDREAVVGMIVDAAKQESLTLTPPELVTTPEVFRRADGTCRFRPRHSVVFTSEALLAAEDRLLARADDMTRPGGQTST